MISARGGGLELSNADACVNFACKRPNFADVGGGVKNGKFLRTSFMDGPIPVYTRYHIYARAWCGGCLAARPNARDDRVSCIQGYIVYN